MSICIVHTADWQLGKRFGRGAEGARTALHEQRFETVRRLGALAAERGADAVLVAGDVFDSTSPSDDTLRRARAALESFAGPWVLLPGNHDPARAEGVWTRLRSLGLPDNVLVADRPEPIILAEARLQVLPAPLQRAHDTADLTAWFDAAPRESRAVRVGLAHGSVLSRLPAEADARNPVAEDRARRAGLDYLALGDWHGTMQIDARTWYAGTPEADRPKANDSGNVLIVHVPGPGAAPTIEPVRVGRYRWRDERATVHCAADVEALAARLGTLAPLDAHVVDLAVEGTAGLGVVALLEDRLDELAVRLRDLRLDDSGLIAEPSDDDVARMAPGGFIAAAVARLRAQAAEPDPTAAATARLALKILYLECTLSR